MSGGSGNWADETREKVSCGGEIVLTDEALQEMFAGKVDEEFTHGVETIRVFRIGRWVYKIRRENFDVIELHNKFFGDVTPYEKVANVADGTILYRQPFVELMPGSGEEARTELFEILKRRYSDVMRIEFEMWADGWHFDDLKDANLGLLKGSRKLAVLDCLIRQRTKEEVLDIWQRDSIAAELT